MTVPESKSARRAVILNGADIDILNSHFAGFKEVGADTQALLGYNGSGPFRIVNNYLEAAGENVMFGGSDATIPELVPSDIEIRRNHLFKPLSWKAGHPTYAGVTWQVKNLLELKNARRVRIEGNLLENNWDQAQPGYGVLFTVKNQDGGNPWAVVEDVLFANNHLKSTPHGFNILGTDYMHPSGLAQRIMIRNNVVETAFPSAQHPGRRGTFLLTSGATDIRIEHNTALVDQWLYAYGNQNPGLRVTDNLFTSGNQHGDDAGGNATFGRYLAGATIKRNLAVTTTRMDWVFNDADNYLVPTIEGVGFADYANGNYRLKDDSPYNNAATDGTDVGANIDYLEGVIAGHRYTFSLERR